VTGEYRIMGQYCIVDAIINVGNKGTASGLLNVTTPLSVASAVAVSASIYTGVTQACMGVTVASSPRIFITLYDGTTVWVNTYTASVHCEFPY
jgi:hypothetical protein